MGPPKRSTDIPACGTSGVRFSRGETPPDMANRTPGVPGGQAVSSPPERSTTAARSSS